MKTEANETEKERMAYDRRVLAGQHTKLEMDQSTT
jgi:hypothetical protein